MIAGLINMLLMLAIFGGIIYFIVAVLLPSIKASKEKAAQMADLEKFREAEAVREAQMRAQAQRELEAEMGEVPTVEIHRPQS
jgi:hypothetical protein